MHKLTIQPLNKTVNIEDGANLRTALITNGVEVKSKCGGHGSCGDCIVVCETGGEENLNTVEFEEKQLIGNVFHMTKERLSCQTTIHGDLVVSVDAHLNTTKKNTDVKKRSAQEAADIVSKRQEDFQNKPQRQGGFKKPKGFKTK